MKRDVANLDRADSKTFWDFVSESSRRVKLLEAWHQAESVDQPPLSDTAATRSTAQSGSMSSDPPCGD